VTKAENKAAAKAYLQEKQAREREERLRQDIAADLEQLRIFRDYFSRERKVWSINTATLISLIDDYAERLTGRRDALWAKDARHMS
jgi:hypothetical protein